MASLKKIRARLEAAQQSETLIRLNRVSRPDQRFDGFVVGVGQKWVLIARTMNGGFFDGYAAIRLREVRRVRKDRSFEPAFARTQPEWPPRPPVDRPVIDLDTTSGMLATFLTPDALLSIERDKKYDVLWVGVPNELIDRQLYLWEVRSDASWHDAPLGYPIGSITVVCTDDHYLRGLAVVAGPAPVEEMSHHWTAQSRRPATESVTLPAGSGV